MLAGDFYAVAVGGGGGAPKGAGTGRAPLKAPQSMVEGTESEAAVSSIYETFQDSGVWAHTIVNISKSASVLEFDDKCT